MKMKCWTISAHIRSKLEAAEMLFFRRMLKIPWTDNVTNEEVLKKIGTERKLLTTVGIFGACYEKRKFGEFDTHGTH